MTNEILFILISYLVGAIPFGFIVYYLAEKKDIRGEGSGNIGATNILRTKGRFAAIVTLLLDIAKGSLPVLYGIKHFDSPMVIVAGGMAAVLGHLFPVYLKFKGGKGVATFLGVFIAFHFPTALVFGAVFLTIVYLTRYVSAGSIAAIIAVFFFVLFNRVVEISIIVFIISLLLLIRHHQNIRRIVDGSEAKLIWEKNE